MNTDTDLLDTLLGVKGKGVELLQEYRTLHSVAMNVDALPITSKQKDRLQAAFRLRFLHEVSDTLNSPADVFAAVSDLQIERQEHVDVLVLDTRNRLVHRENAYKGSLNTSQIRVAEIFRPAIIRKRP